MRDDLIDRQRHRKAIPGSNFLWSFLYALPLLLVIRPVNADDQSVPPKTPVGEVSRPSDQNSQKAGSTRSESTSWQDLFAASIFESGLDAPLPYRILPPLGMTKAEIQAKLSEISEGKNNADTDPSRFPLVLFLHGAGERGNDNEKQLVHGASEFARQDNREDFPSFVVFPQCPQGARWVESDWALRSGAGEFSVQLSEPMRCAMEMVDHLMEVLPIDPSRVYVTGLSMGGMGAWYAAASEPERFAAMLEVCGGGDPSWASRYAGVPIWAFHGQDDSVVPVERGREMIQALSESGHWPELRYVEYPGVGHNSWTQTYARRDVFEWLFSQQKSNSDGR